MLKMLEDSVKNTADCGGKHVDLSRREFLEAGEDCVVRSFLTCTLQEMLLV
jgi:hypothetical protein